MDIEKVNDIAIEDLRYLALDQSTPQTVTGGAPIFREGVSIYNADSRISYVSFSPVQDGIGFSFDSDFATSQNYFYLMKYSGLDPWIQMQVDLDLNDNDLTTTGTVSSTGFQISGVAATGTILRGNGTSFIASTSTYPDTVSAERILYATSANVIGSSANLNFDGTNFSIGNIATSWIFACKGTTTGLLFSDLTTSMDFVGYNGSSYNDLHFRAGSATQLYIDTTGNVGIGITSPTATLHLKASTATANTASLKIDVGIVATSAVSGNVESDGAYLYWTDSSNARQSLNGITGEIKMWTTATAPTGWLKCDGSAVSRTTYAALFVVIGTTFGAGNGTTTFNIPNLAGKFAIGVDGTYTLASTGGSVNTSSGTANVSDSGHTHNIYNTAVSYESGIDTVSIAANTETDYANITDSGHTHDNSLPPYLALNFIIKY